MNQFLTGIFIVSLCNSVSVNGFIIFPLTLILVFVNRKYIETRLVAEHFVWTHALYVRPG